MNKFLRYVLIIVGLTLGLVITAVLPLWDDKSITDADLTVAVATAVNPTENAYEILPKLAEFTPTETNALKLINTSAPLADRLGKLSPAQQEKFIADTIRLVDKFKQASIKPTYQCPKSLNVYGRTAEGCDLSTLQKMSHLVAIHAYYYGTNGNLTQATMLTESLLKLGHLIQQQEEPGMLIEYLISIAMKQLAVDVIDAKITKDISTEKYQVQQVSIANALRREYKDTKAILLEGFGHDPIPTYWFQPNQTLNIYAEFVRADLARVMTPCTEAPTMSATNEAFDNKKQSLNLKWLLSQNAKGNLMLRIISASYGAQGGLRDKACELNTRLSK